MSGHRLPFDLAKAPYHTADPGDGADISISHWAHISITTGASGETNTLNNPTNAGQRVAMMMITDGGGDRVITCDSAINKAGNTIITFAAVDDSIVLESFLVDSSGNCEWRVVHNNGITLS